MQHRHPPGHRPRIQGVDWSHPALASSIQDHPPMSLSSPSARPKNIPGFASAPTYMRHSQAIPSQHAPHLTKIPVADQCATRAGVIPPSRPHTEPSTPPSSSEATSAPYNAPHAPNPMDFYKANAQLPAPYNMLMQQTIHPLFRQGINFRTYRLANRNPTISSRQMRQVAKLPTRWN